MNRKFSTDYAHNDPESPHIEAFFSTVQSLENDQTSSISEPESCNQKE
jgi:hypothetical protein